MASSINNMISKGILILNIKTFAIVGLFISCATSISAEVIRVEGGKLNSIFIVYKSDSTSEKSKLVCNVSSSNGNIIGMGVAAREEPLTRILIGIPEDKINEIVDVFCEEK